MFKEVLSCSNYTLKKKYHVWCGTVSLGNNRSLLSSSKISYNLHKRSHAIVDGNQEWGRLLHWHQLISLFLQISRHGYLVSYQNIVWTTREASQVCILSTPLPTICPWIMGQRSMNAQIEHKNPRAECISATGLPTLCSHFTMYISKCRQEMNNLYTHLTSICMPNHKHSALLSAPNSEPCLSKK